MSSGKTILEQSFMAVLLRVWDPQQGLNEATKVRLRDFLTEFGIFYVSPKTGKSVAPGTMLSYILGVLR